MFMKHYAPNRCEQSIEAFEALGGDQDRCEQRSEVFVIYKKIYIYFYFFFFFYLFIFFFLGGGGGGGGGGGFRLVKFL